MVERPIKKSERQAMMQAAETTGEASVSEADSFTDGNDGEIEALPKRETPRPIRVNKDSEKRVSKESKDKQSKGKGRSRDTEKPAPASIALMRGPRPAKAKELEVTEEPETTTEIATEIDEESIPVSSDDEQATES